MNMHVHARRTAWAGVGAVAIGLVAGMPAGAQELTKPIGSAAVSRNATTGVQFFGLGGNEILHISTSLPGGRRVVLFRLVPATGPIFAGAGCQDSGFAMASCDPSLSESQTVTVLANGGDDLVEFTPVDADWQLAGSTRVEGGAGNDLLTGSTAADTILGGDGNDSLSDGGRTDTLSGGAGNDTLIATGQFQIDRGDVFDGGPGVDVVSYELHPRRVLVSLDGVLNDGSPGTAAPVLAIPPESDNVQPDVEGVHGTEFDDVITAAGGQSEGPEGRYNFLGLGGDDVLTVTGPVAARLSGGAGSDTLGGGPLDDELDAKDGLADTLDCGGGTDILVADLRDPAPPSCETIAIAAVREGPNLAIATASARLRGSNRVRVRLACPRKVGTLGCRGRATARLAGSSRGGPARRYSLRAGRSTTLLLPLRAAEAARLRRQDTGKLRIVAVERGHFGPKTTIRSVRARAR